MIDQATMKPLIWLPFSCAAILTFSSCANNKSAANDPLGTGPFDSHGNYREDWADDPTKWRKPGSRQAPADDLPVVAANELPPANATPLAPVDTNSSKPRSSKPGSTPKPSASTAAAEPKTVSAKPKPKSKPKPTSSTYVVKKGDTLSGIASRNGSSVSAIRRANSISGSMIHPGDKLKIPRR
jgi:LysM repeat protein